VNKKKISFQMRPSTPTMTRTGPTEHTQDEGQTEVEVNRKEHNEDTSEDTEILTGRDKRSAMCATSQDVGQQNIVAKKDNEHSTDSANMLNI